VNTTDRQTVRGQLERLHNKEFAQICWDYQITFGFVHPIIVGRDEWMRHMLKDHPLDAGCSRKMRDRRLIDFFKQRGVL
jgi:2-polyprenyl-3-methyl-5-hydroxy-6-metoxy-1,4-benzoquinol methylase